MKTFILVAIVIFSVDLYCQESKNGGSFSVYCAAGVGYAAEYKYQNNDRAFSSDVEIIPYNPLLSGRIGIKYNSIANIYAMQLGVGIETGYTAAESTQHISLGEEGKTKQSIIPIDLIFFFDTPSKLRPIVKVGLGVVYKKLTEEFSNYPELNLEGSKWFFSITGGAGIAYEINNFWEVSIILQDDLINGEIVAENGYGDLYGLRGDQSQFLGVVQLSFKL
jgi:opacity protein-like surface antigen